MIDRALERRVIVCCGAGGVGKTTVSAAIALELARRGERAAVVTIDPARRLADALGMSGLGDEPRAAEREELERAGVPYEGALWGLQLDAKATFDRLVARYAPDEEARDRILANRIYQHMSSAVAGSQEYMAVERLHELLEDARFDRVVLDTPPAENALDFLDAPERITRFVGGKALRTLTTPASGATGVGRRALAAGTSAVMAVLRRVTGAELLDEIGEFLSSFEGMYAGFAERAAIVGQMLRSEEAAFVVVSAPQEEPAQAAVALARRLETDGFPFAGVVLNRVHDLPPPAPVAARPLQAQLEDVGAANPSVLADATLAALEDVRRVAIRDLDIREAIVGAVGAEPAASVPALAREPVDLEGLGQVAAALAERRPA